MSAAALKCSDGPSVRLIGYAAILLMRCLPFGGRRRSLSYANERQMHPLPVERKVKPLALRMPSASEYICLRLGCIQLLGFPLQSYCDL